MSKKSKSPEVEPEAAVEGQIETAAEESSADEGGASSEELARLLEEAHAKAEENWEKVVRVQAELENSQRRAQRDVENAHKYALEKFAQELLPVKDSLELGLAAAEGSDHEVADKLREGTELTLKMLTTAMEKFGIKEVDPQGDTFNPEWHQAMTMQPSAEYEPNTIMAVMQKGYLLNGRLLRPAMVVVSKGSGTP
ncbi:MAG: nucleotide exchange factor GrpE [Gammaproteobacteria bacterium]|nr:nucleotide exchange factor GrpE [Gammaproteobacteria bacterium]MCW8841470.1 nucleotide exchange factor GrpE [Gammaproteobacteria bacterium]MCW8927585.1 nucleotide exchange factor GrpE [Gammaproteobacteria bacterium]MCW8958696.1 nucleotide exchange factor GrpE [Gammaproteobacteria bacterium]MCW8974019.1 nucleotide exchange factor GrpE [Gammaproteobacteria bacterium]